MPRKKEVQCQLNKVTYAQEWKAAKMRSKPPVIELSSDSDSKYCHWDGSVNHYPGNDTSESESDSDFSSQSGPESDDSDCIIDLEGPDLMNSMERAALDAERKAVEIEKMRREVEAELEALKKPLGWDKITEKKTTMQWKKANKSLATRVHIRTSDRNMRWKGEAARKAELTNSILRIRSAFISICVNPMLTNGIA